jgi:hypothetical protein
VSYLDYDLSDRRYQERMTSVATSPGIGPRASGTSVEIRDSPTNVTINVTFNVGTPTPEVMTSLEAIKNAIETDKAGFAELLVSSGVITEVIQRCNNQRLEDKRPDCQPEKRRGIFGFLGRGT